MKPNRLTTARLALTLKLAGFALDLNRANAPWERPVTSSARWQNAWLEQPMRPWERSVVVVVRVRVRVRVKVKVKVKVKSQSLSLSWGLRVRG